MKRLELKKFLLICSGVIVSGFLMYHFGIKRFIGAQFQVAEYGQFKDIIETSGIIVRDEVVLRDDSYNSGNLKYLLSDGEKISKNGVIAEVYPSPEDAKTSYKIDDLNKEIEILEKLNFTKYNIFKGINFINNQINDEIRNLLISLGNVKLLEARDYRQKILYLLNERQIVLGKEINLDEKIKELMEEKSKLLSTFSKNSSVIKSPESGDFINYTDGYEDIVNYKDVLRSDFSNIDFDGVINRSLKNNDIHTIGKIIKSEDWYIVCNISADEASKVFVGEEVKVNIPSSELFSEIPCTIAAVNKRNNLDDFSLVVSCNYMDKSLACIRKENIKIVLNEYSGLKVKRSAIHKYSNGESEERFGVYVRSGGYLKLKKANPLFWGEDEVICSYNSEEMLDDTYLQIGDNVVGMGTNLFEGKRLR